MEIKNRIAAAGLEKAYRYLEKDPVQNLPKLMELVDRFAGDAFAPQRDVVRRVVNDPENNWNRLLCSLWTDIDSEVLKKIFTNFLLNANFIGWEKQEKAREKYNCNIPWAILMDPTSACNLHCTGCWAAEYGNRLNLSSAELEDILRQGKELGIHFYLFSGGERAQGGHPAPLPGAPGLRVFRLHQRHPHRRGLCRRDAARQELPPRHLRRGL